jgi:peroxiredoxin
MRTLLLSLMAVSLFASGELAGRRAPGFALPDSKGKVYDLADYRGKVVVLEFMQSNCPHCANSARTFERIYKKYGGRVMVLSVANPPDNAQSVAKYIQAHGVTSPVLFDCGQAAYSYMKTASFDIPHVFLIDADGMIRNNHGYSPLTRSVFEGQALDIEIDKLLQKK